MKKKLSLKKLEVSSFNTNLDSKITQTVKGGLEDNSCATRCFIDCQSNLDSGCGGSCGGGGTTGGGTGTGPDNTNSLLTCYLPC